MPNPDPERLTFPLQRTWAGAALLAGALFTFQGARSVTFSLLVLGLVGLGFGAFVLSSRLVLQGSVLTRRLAGQPRGSVDLAQLDAVEVLADPRPRLTLVDAGGARLRIRPKNYSRERALHQAMVALVPDGCGDEWLTAF